MMLGVVLGASVAFLIACANNSSPHHTALALYSWKPKGEAWHFALIRDPWPKDVSRADVIRVAPPLVGVSALKGRLASTPHTSWAIVWRDDPPEHTFHYPPTSVCDEIIAFGRRRGLNIERWLTLYE